MDSLYSKHVGADTVTVYERVLFLFNGGMVRRYHTLPTNKEITVAEHSWLVAALLTVLLPAPSAALLRAALFHDCAEQLWGDLPAPVKWLDPNAQEIHTSMEQTTLQAFNCYNTITPDEQQALQLADSFAGMLECCKECALGSKFLKEAYNRWHARIQMQSLRPQEKLVLDAIQKLWSQATIGDIR